MIGIPPQCGTETGELEPMKYILVLNLRSMPHRKADTKKFHHWILLLFVMFYGFNISGQNIQWAETVYSFS